MREMITISVGQAGIQLGESIWKQYCAEHNIHNDGKRYKKSGPTKIPLPKQCGFFTNFFEETNKDQYIPRSLMIDLEPNVIDDIKTSNLRKLFDADFLLSGKEDAANNFARGFYTVGTELIDKTNDRIRKLVDHCDHLRGFTLTHSVCGGTGSGLGSLILENIAVNYRKKSKYGFDIYPSTQLSTSVVEPYNSVFTTHWLLDHTETSVVFDNEALYEICQRNLDIKRPSYHNINRLITKTVSSITTSLRFEPEMYHPLIDEFETNLVPFPRLHFMISSIAPFTKPIKMETCRGDVQSLTSSCFEKESFSVKVPDFDVISDKYMAITVNYHGNVRAKEANATVQWLKATKKVTFVEWCPTGFKLQLNEEPLVVLCEDDISPSNRFVSMVGNNTAIARVFTERMSRKFDLLYNQRAFVHWYIGEGMEEGEFAEARQDLGWLERDYQDVLYEQRTDDGSDIETDDD